MKNKKGSKTIFSMIVFILITILIILIGFQVSEYLCPIKYKALINKYSKEYNLDKELVYSVINAESRYNQRALSNKGAIGLMQIMPATGEWLIELLNNNTRTEDLENLNNLNNIENIEESLYTPEINIQLGCFYLSYLIEKFQSEENALCAYNAGASNVNEWLQNPNYSQNGILTEIPFGETKRYVQKIKYFKIGYTVKLKVLELLENLS